MGLKENFDVCENGKGDGDEKGKEMMFFSALIESSSSTVLA